MSSSEYFRLIGQDCSSELHHRLECAFRLADNPSPERYALITHNWLGDCPMHDADGLCMLHKECSENALPAICRLYPRRMENSSGLLKCSCTNGCEGVTELLALKEDPISFHREELAARSVLSTENPNPELSRACIDIMQNRALSLPERLTRIRRLLESFAQSGRIDRSAAEAPPAEAPRDTSCALPLMIHILEQLSETSPSLQHFGSDAFERYRADGRNLPAIYESDARHFQSVLPSWPLIFENLLVNHMFYENFPFVDSRVTPAEAGFSLTAAYAALRVGCIGYMSCRNVLADFVDAAAGLFRFIEHTPFYLNAGRLVRAGDGANAAGADSLAAL